MQKRNGSPKGIIIDEDSETKGFIIKYTGNGPIPKQLEYA